MLHLIALAKSNDKDIAYHYATTDPKQFATQKAKLGDINNQPVSIHVLKTDSKNFASVQKMDPYFAAVKEITSLSQFSKLLS